MRPQKPSVLMATNSLRVLEVTDRVAEPLVASELLVRRMLLRTSTGAVFVEVGDVQVAVELASVAPSSWQYALALAEIAHAEAGQAIPKQRGTRTPRWPLHEPRAIPEPCVMP